MNVDVGHRDKWTTYFLDFQSRYYMAAVMLKNRTDCMPEDQFKWNYIMEGAIP